MSARGSSLVWGPMMPYISRLSPKIIRKFSSMMDTEAFAAGVANASDEQIAEAMSSKLRPVILGEIVRRMQDEFIADRASDLDAVIQFDIAGRADGGSDIYQIRVVNSTCTSAAGQAYTDKPTSNIEIQAVDFVKLATGNAQGIDLYIGGKLKWDGGMMMLTRLTRMFNIPEIKGTEPVAAAA